MSQAQQDGFSGRVKKQYLESYLSGVNAIADEGKLDISQDGFYTGATDPAKVALVEATLEPSAFEDFEAMESTHGLRFRDLHPLVSQPDYATATMQFKPEFKKLELGVGPYHYTNATLDPDTIRSEAEIPDTDLGFVADMNVDRLRKAVYWFDEFATHVRMGYDPANSEFWMEATERTRQGNMGTDDGSFGLPRSELEYVRGSGPADSHFSLDYFKDIVDGIPEGKTVTVQIGEEYPMKISYEIGDGTETHGTVLFMQAARIQTD